MATRDLTRPFVNLRTDVKAKVARRRQMASHSPDVHHEANSLMRNAEMRSDIDLEAAAALAQDTPLWVDAVTDVNIHVARVKDLSKAITISSYSNRGMCECSGQVDKDSNEAPDGSL
ncbi:hypothetical protein AaE_007214 [Aphanomyces astaci]|uniref:Uncharacterized protein n=1 Tax=Aphanomyces astaci TaxID=112090 RepID=A0A6A5AB94_APHAT|nr:hypothetical protein AaE_007214 [Aphanomyces astaci]